MLQDHDLTAWNRSSFDAQGQTYVKGPEGPGPAVATSDRLPWPAAVTTIALLSATLWFGIASLVANLIH